MLISLPLANIIDNLENVGQQTGFSIQQFIAQCIAFLAMCFVLQKFAWKPVLVILEKRRHAIEEAMANAERIKQELADAEAARLQILHKANEQANAIIADAHRAAAQLAETGNRDAASQAADIVRRAREAAIVERDRLMSELKRDIGALVVQTTEKVAGKVLTTDDQSRLKDETIRQLQNN